MRLTSSDTGVGCVACVLALTTLGCPSEADTDTSAAGSTTSETDTTTTDGASGSTVGQTQADGTGTGTADGTADGTASDGPVDPTDGVEPPTVDCGAGDTFIGGILIESDEDIAQLDGIAIVTGDFIVDGTNYSNLDFMSCLTEIRGNIQIFGNPSLLDMSGTDNLVKVGRLPSPNPTPSNPNSWDTGAGTILISNNAQLTSINGFSSLTDIGEQGEAGECPAAPAGVDCISLQSLVIRDNDLANGVDGFGSLQFIYGSLTVSQNDAITHIDGLASLIGIGGFFAVNNNPSLCISSVNAVGEGLEFLGDMKHSTTSGNDSGC